MSECAPFRMSVIRSPEERWEHENINADMIEAGEEPLDPMPEQDQMEVCEQHGAVWGVLGCPVGQGFRDAR